MSKHIKLSLLLVALLVASCNINTTSNNTTNSNSTINNSSSSVAYVDINENKLIISEYVEGKSNAAIELYNFSEEVVNLNDYTFNVYGSNSPEPTAQIQLNGTLEPKDTFVIVGSISMDEDLISKADLVSDKLLFNGSQALALAYKSHIVDVMGIIGYKLDYAVDVVLVRKPNHITPTTTFDEYDWIRYIHNEYQYLGNFGASVTEEELLAGPRLTEEDYQAPFFKEGSNNQVGGGGVAKVTVYSLGDGDTTQFRFPSELGFPQGSKVRYQNINTPETMSDYIEEWGIPAKQYNHSQLNNAKEILVQSVKDGSIYETYGRLLGWVWVDGELLNFKIVKEGYSLLKFESIDTMTYKGVTYSNYLYHAMLYAKKNGLKLHGDEKDPTWNYEKNQSNYA